jgi:hypothetical protein
MKNKAMTFSVGPAGCVCFPMNEICLASMRDVTCRCINNFSYGYPASLSRDATGNQQLSLIKPRLPCAGPDYVETTGRGHVVAGSREVPLFMVHDELEIVHR